MAEANAVRPQSSKSAAFSIPDTVIDRHPFAALHESAFDAVDGSSTGT
jgi:hypothetical protein